MIDALESPWGHPSQTTIVVGARGTGKTALLRSMVAEAERRGWVAASVSCFPGMQEDILQQARRRGANLLEPKGKARVTGVNVGQLLGVQWSVADAGEANWRSRVSDVLDELALHEAGLLILVDEVDPDLDEMIQLAGVYQQLVGEERKIALFMAGLPHRVSRLLTNKSVSFLRRASQRSLSSIAPEDVGSAFRETVAVVGKTVSDKALADAVRAIDGFPYMMQLVGYRACQLATDEETIGECAVLEGAKLAEEDMRMCVLQATLDELSPNDLEFLAAMLQDDDSSRPEDIEKRLDRSSAHVAVYRKRLLEQGVILDLGRKRFRLALPGLREYLPEYLENNL
ncbi:ATP-binding protein [Eggerthellaceae bacterium zg-886]|uniref:ATP-binding protein n=2 Tax=Xiamenia xianingshaonis TaxID=2682776 RepID=A0A9E6MQD3_9ACTN|nr:ATP-binding protein [Xiamenia xianingshaonis]QTU84027.1 ATP-binding protein [Xiamenia xianingshaonis]